MTEWLNASLSQYLLLSLPVFYVWCSSGVGRSISSVSPAAAAEDVCNAGAAGAEADTAEAGQEGQQQNHCQYQPHPPGGSALTIQQGHSCLLVTEGKVGLALRVTQTLASPHAVNEVVQVCLNLEKQLLHKRSASSTPKVLKGTKDGRFSALPIYKLKSQNRHRYFI